MRAMKDSGIEWIGQIPQNWNVGKLGFFIEAINGDRSSNYPSGNDLQDSGIPFLTSNNLESDILTLNDCKYISEDKYSVMSGLKVKIDDIIYCLRGSVGKCSINKSINEGTVASSLMGIRCTGMHPDYLLYILKSSIVETQNSLFMNGTCAANLSAENVCGYIVPVPDVHEQIKIANYLSKRCAELDALIAAKEKINTLLKERRQSIIYEAVTKGLNPDTPMKDSGIEWIGEIPEHWTVKKIKYLGTFRNGLTYSPDNVTNEESGTLVLRSSNIQNGNVVFDDNVYVDMDIPEILQVAAGDILICSRNGSRELIGKNAIIPENVKASFGAFMMIFRCGDPKYLYYILNSNVFSYYLGTFLTSTVNQLTAANFGNIKVVYCDSAEEREEIVAHLDQKCEELDAAVSTNEATIQKLKEYRQSIIYEAVTGKIVI